MQTPSVHVRRALVVGAAALAALGVVLVPNGARAAISTQTFCANVPSGASGFTDIGDTAPHTRNIECLKGSGVTSGTTATTYTPRPVVRRGQMATFVANMIDRANALDAPGAPNLPDLPSAAASQDRFTDDEGSNHEANINRLAQANIVSGQTATTFNPDGEVSRAQMATFLERLLVAAGAGVPGDAPDAFTDDSTSVHQTAINRLAAMGIVGGVGGGRYDPEGRVTRAQMGTFLARAVWVATGGALVAAAHDYFVDDSIDLHEANINVVAELGIAGGTAPDLYNPGGRVSRAQMASFLARALDAALTR